MKPDEGLLNPYENTGAVSTWRLDFPRPTSPSQSELLYAITDIVPVLKYTSRTSDTTFARQVTELVNAIENPEQGKSGKGARNHG